MHLTGSRNWTCSRILPRYSSSAGSALHVAVLMTGDLAEAPFGGNELATTLVEPSTTKASYRPRPVFPDDEAFVPLAAELGAVFAPRAADLDRDKEFATKNFERLRSSGFSALAVP